MVAIVLVLARSNHLDDDRAIRRCESRGAGQSGSGKLQKHSECAIILPKDPGFTLKVIEKAEPSAEKANLLRSDYDSADMKRNLRETKVKEISDAEVVPDLRPFGSKPNALCLFNLPKSWRWAPGLDSN
jgi:hypothetical protein